VFDICRQDGLGLRRSKWFGRNPHAEFVILKARFEVGHQYVDQVLLVLIELANVGTPWNVTNDGDSRVPRGIPLNGSSDACKRLKISSPCLPFLGLAPSPLHMSAHSRPPTLRNPQPIVLHRGLPHQFQALQNETLAKNGTLRSNNAQTAVVRKNNSRPLSGLLHQTVFVMQAPE